MLILELALALSILGAPDTGGDVDPRVELVRLQLRHDAAAALARTEELLDEDPAAGAQGLVYLRGHLLSRLDRHAEAAQAFADAMAASPDLAPWSRYRLAEEQAQTGHPEVAAGLVATLLGSNPPRALVAPGVALLERSIRGGGDCRLLRGLGRLRLSDSQTRRIELARAWCDLREDRVADARDRLLRLLADDTSDDVALEAARRLADPDGGVLHVGPEHRGLESSETTGDRLLVGRAFYDHREFETALRYLASGLVGLSARGGLSPADEYEARYALARSYFWLERWDAAQAAFAAAAAMAPSTQRRAQAIYQQARCHELKGPDSWGRALELFETAAAMQGDRGMAARIAALRLRFLVGDEDGALAIYREISRRSRDLGVRSALFLAASDISAGRTSRAGGWLAEAARFERGETQEIAYWRGRLEELQGRLAQAVATYWTVAVDDPHHPFGRDALRRLRGAGAEAGGPTQALARVASAEAVRRAAGSRVDDLYGAWLVLGDAGAGRSARQALTARLRADPARRAFLDLSAAVPESWPLWRSGLVRPEDKLLALGLFGEGSSAVLRHFPVGEPHLAYTGSLALSQAGATHRSLYVAEVLSKRVPSDVPAELLPRSYRQLLYPFRFSYLILREGQKRKIDPFLLAAIIREESRYDPSAFSGASARGLTQFVFPTARRLALEVEVDGQALGAIDPWDLHRPEVAVALGAAYLRELGGRFDGALPEVVSAYNAGEPQAELWRHYCIGDGLEEYLTKIAFRETRAYLAKVLRSREHYVELYGEMHEPPAAARSAAETQNDRR